MINGIVKDISPILNKIQNKKGTTFFILRFVVENKSRKPEIISELSYLLDLEPKEFNVNILRTSPKRKRTSFGNIIKKKSKKIAILQTKTSINIFELLTKYGNITIENKEE